MLFSTVGPKVKQQALWFIQEEQEKILHNHAVGAVTRDHAVGALSMLYQIASRLRDMECMRNLQQTITDIRSVRFPGLPIRESAERLEFS